MFEMVKFEFDAQNFKIKLLSALVKHTPKFKLGNGNQQCGIFPENHECRTRLGNGRVFYFRNLTPTLSHGRLDSQLSF